MSVLRELVYKIGVKADAEQLNRFKATAEGVTSAFSKLTGVAAAALAAASGMAVGLGLLTKNTASFAEEVDRASRSLQMSRQEFQEYQAGFAALGGTTDDLMDALATINERTLKAIEGSSTYAKEFARVGIAVKDLKGLKPAQLFDTFTAAAAKATDRNAALAASVALFGDDLGRRIMPALVEGGEGFDALRKLVADTGLALDDVAIDKGRKLAFELRRLDFLARGLSRQLGAELGPALTTLAMRVGDFLQERGTQLVGWFDAAGEEAGRWATKLNEAINQVNAAFGGDTEALDNYADALYRISLVLTYGAAGVGIIAAVGALASGLAYIGVAGAALYGVITTLTAAFEDLWVYFAGGASLTGLLAEKFDWLDVELHELRKAFAVFRQSTDQLWAATSRLFALFTKQGEEGFSLLEVGLAVTQGLIVVLLNALTRFVALLIRITAWFINTAAAAGEMSDLVISAVRNMGRVALVVFDEVSGVIANTIDLLVLLPRIVGEVAAKIRSGDLSGAMESALAANNRIGQNIVAYGSNNSSAVRRLAATFTEATGGPSSVRSVPAFAQRSAEQAKATAEQAVRYTTTTVQNRIGAINLTPQVSTDDPAAWGQAAGEALIAELRTADNLLGGM